jgi:Putative cyclase
VCASGSRTPSEEGWIDISVPLRSGMVHWPDNPPVRIERMLDIERGDAANVSVISLGSHTGTHMDAPIHFVPGGEGMDRMPLDATVGRARVMRSRTPFPSNLTNSTRTGSAAARVSCSRRRTRPGVGGLKLSSRITCTSPKRRPVTSRIAESDRRRRLPFGRRVR